MGCATPAAQHTNLPSSLPYTLVSWYLPEEVQVMFSKEMKQQSKTQCHSLKQQLQSCKAGVENTTTKISVF